MRILRLLLVCGFLWSTAAAAVGESQLAPVPAAQAQPGLMDNLHASVLFSGLVTSEDGERYGYYFRMRRNLGRFWATALVVRAKNNKVILFEDAEAILEDGSKASWRVGRAFVRYNPINDSWIFGVKPEGRAGFNFRVDMLKPGTNTRETHALHKGITLEITQTSRVNGHLQTTDGEVFVTAPHAWFRQVVLKEQMALDSTLMGLFCRFSDGSGFYAARLPEKSALRGAVAGWRDASGQSQEMSQFVQVHKGEDGVWKVMLSAPKRELSFVNALLPPPESGFVRQPELVAGFFDYQNTTGFCAFSEDFIGGQRFFPALATQEKPQAAVLMAG
ncbi:hypothetical protein E3226_009780 [Legionella geestiana]|uniref:hypothetical protein n=1 Tax=Legionella geestiana TaxID=45065 RepID=UPI0010929ABE|nr:hypothetical protein [Legionella geestiana]QDQ40661.1 hypothetical protein E3226_009780 [Legionella geestiana]